ncbi:hypothetical protein QMK33_08780 [Hymenobacter sp. H14-R3]|uniref:hypothetical protein n=1 Tax=Hymenobacter sp. H14-R3 TaxID=3046308 RepID=UPI0024B9D9E4|nr:hypothetical protein [Hymenobacter sp. H14-R3]MDJ0365246.1 hypothetical protein [Hymenobacter sp. H14-R3]
MIDKALFVIAEKALCRQYYFAKKAGQKENISWPYTNQYLQRIEVMQAALNSMKAKKPAN